MVYIDIGFSFLDTSHFLNLTLSKKKGGGGGEGGGAYTRLVLKCYPL